MYIMRHGQTEGNVNGIMQGHVDTPLTELGIQKIKQRAEELRHIKFDAVFSSDLLRAKRTAEIIKLDRDIAHETTALLRERSYGKFDGLPDRHYHEELKDLLEQRNKLAYEERKKFRLGDNIETDEEIISRVITFLREVSVAYANKTILVVSHGATIKTFLYHLGWADPGSLIAGAIKNTGYAVIDCDGVDFVVRDVVDIEKV